VGKKARPKYAGKMWNTLSNTPKNEKPGFLKKPGFCLHILLFIEVT